MLLVMEKDSSFIFPIHAYTCKYKLGTKGCNTLDRQLLYFEQEANEGYGQVLQVIYLYHFSLDCSMVL